ncbi:MAG TPA: hypothetical protein VHQ23_03020 [Ilumatobacteraceae bacterium]|nr:hypothetical protein [Ilumatobacteraceae bacterium]
MPGNPLTDPNWAADLADTVDEYVGKVRTTVTERAVYAVRAVVFGIIIAIAAPVTITLVIILVTKFLQSVIGLFTDHDSSVWISYTVLGLAMVIGGAFTMRKRYEPEPA